MRTLTVYTQYGSYTYREDELEALVEKLRAQQAISVAGMHVAIKLDGKTAA